jgi:hypothetical protein
METHFVSREFAQIAESCQRYMKPEQSTPETTVDTSHQKGERWNDGAS